MSENQGLNVIAELDDGICIARVGIDQLREQDMNARVMDDAKFDQLVRNIEKRGTLEQLPYCAMTDRGIEIVSGHHRTRAARQAGLKEVTVLLDRSGLSRSAIAAKQLAHNSIEGTDDPDMLRKIAATITDVDDMLETALGDDFFEKLDAEVSKMPLPAVDFDWKTIQFMFLPSQLADFERLVDTATSGDWNGIAGTDQFEETAEALRRTQKFEDVRNVGAALHMMALKALGEYPEDDEEYASIASVFGRGAIPKETAEKLKTLVKTKQKCGDIENPWEIFDLLADKAGE